MIDIRFDLDPTGLHLDWTMLDMGQRLVKSVREENDGKEAGAVSFMREIEGQTV